MTDTPWTSGPYTFLYHDIYDDEGTASLVGADGTIVIAGELDEAMVPFGFGGDKAAANARLFRAAPRLVTALHLLLEAAESKFYAPERAAYYAPFVIARDALELAGHPEHQQEAKDPPAGTTIRTLIQSEEPEFVKIDLEYPRGLIDTAQKRKRKDIEALMAERDRQREELEQLRKTLSQLYELYLYNMTVELSGCAPPDEDWPEEMLEVRTLLNREINDV